MADMHTRFRRSGTIVALLAGVLTAAVSFSCATAKGTPEIPPAAAVPEAAPAATPEKASAVQPQPERSPAAVPEKSPPPEKAPPPEAPSTEQVLSGVSSLLSKGDYAAALSAFDSLPPEVRSRTDIALLRASVLASADRIADARAAASEVLKAEPKNPEALFVAAAVEGADGKDKERKAFLERAVAADPKHVPSLAALGSVALRSRVYRSAEEFYDRALALDPANAEALIGKARSRRAMDDPKGAERVLNKAIADNPAWALPLQERARLYRENDFLKNALADLDAAVVLAPDDYWIALDRGNVLLDMMRKADALTEFVRASTLYPEHFLSYVYSAGLREEAGDWAGAERDYEKVTKYKSDYYFAFEALGILKMRDGRWAEAADAFVEAFKRAPNHPQYALLVSLAWMRSGRTKDVRPFLAKVLPKLNRETIEWYILRLYHDQSGDTDVAVRIEKEKNLDTRARMLYYFAEYYAARGNDTLARRFHLQVRDLNRQGMIEWRLNEWALESSAPKG